MKIKGLYFDQTCFASPEQYDVYDDCENKVGYVRLRWGSLTCEYPWSGGEEIYYASIGDGWTGVFQNEQQRKYHLTMIANKILEKINT